jgi:hypothetical protein
VDFDALLFGYVSAIIISLSVAWALHYKGRRGKFPRALLISASAEILISLATYFSYPYFVAVPTSHSPPPVDPLGPFLVQAIQRVCEAAAQGAGYEIGRLFDTFIYGALGMLITFSLSFLLPRSDRTTKQVFE